MTDALRVEPRYDASSCTQEGGGGLVLHDRTEVRFKLVVEVPGAPARLNLDGGLPWKRHSRNARAVTAAVPIPDLVGEVLDEVSLTLDFNCVGPGVFTTGGAACFRLNGFRVVRYLLGLECLGRSLDGGTNWIGDCGAVAPEMEGRQYDAFGRIVEVIIGRIRAALPAGTRVLDASMWLGAAEAAHDVAVDDARRIVGLAQRAAMMGAKSTGARVYASGRSNERGEVTYYRLAGGDLKIYAKTDNVVRAEFACNRRKHVRNLIGPDGKLTAEFDADGLCLDLLSPWMERAKPLVLRAVRHLEELAAANCSIVEVVDSLRFLEAFAEGKSAEGAYKPREAAKAEARRARRELLEAGATSMKGHRPGTQLRRLLDSAVASGVLRHDSGTSVFNLAERFAQPVLQLAETVGRLQSNVSDADLAEEEKEEE